MQAAPGTADEGGAVEEDVNAELEALAQVRLCFIALL